MKIKKTVIKRPHTIIITKIITMNKGNKTIVVTIKKTVKTHIKVVNAINHKIKRIAPITDNIDL